MRISNLFRKYSHLFALASYKLLVCPFVIFHYCPAVNSECYARSLLCFLFTDKLHDINRLSGADWGQSRLNHGALKSRREDRNVPGRRIHSFPKNLSPGHLPRGQRRGHVRHHVHQESHHHVLRRCRSVEFFFIVDEIK